MQNHPTWLWGKATASDEAISGSIPGSPSGTRGVVWAEYRSLVCVPNLLGSNPKSLLSAFSTKPLLLIVIRPPEGVVKPGGRLVLFGKSRLISAPGLFFTLSHLTFIIHTLHHSTTLTLIQSCLQCISPYNETR